MKRLMRFGKIIGGMASTARSIFYKPKDTSRAATNVQAELDKINDDVSEINTTLSGLEPTTCELLVAGTGAWTSQPLTTNKHIDDYKGFIVSISANNSNIDNMATYVPRVYFKTKVSNSNYMGGYVTIGTTNISYAVYYGDDTHIYTYTSNTSYIVKVQGVK